LWSVQDLQKIGNKKYCKEIAIDNSFYVKIQAKIYDADGFADIFLNFRNN